jgi:plasmid stabilization system protein ParE
MYKAVILPLAKEDISQAASWYESKQSGLGKRFTNEVRSKVLYIRKNPKASAIRYGITRCAVLNIFPFMIHYNIEEETKSIIINAVFHTSLNPEEWLNR